MSTELVMWVLFAIVLAVVVFVAVSRNRRVKAIEREPVVDREADHAAAETVGLGAQSAPAPAGVRPFLDAPRGQPDDLQQIKGIGPRLSQRLAELGVFHFDQIAAWTPAEMTHVDAQLGQFEGRPERDRWQEQASLLASGDVQGFERLHGRMAPPPIEGTPPAGPDAPTDRGG